MLVGVCVVVLVGVCVFVGVCVGVGIDKHPLGSDVVTCPRPPVTLYQASPSLE